MPDADKWDRDAVQKVGATPMSLHVPREPGVIFRDGPPEEADNPRVGKQPKARAVYLKPSDFAIWLD